MRRLPFAALLALVTACSSSTAPPRQEVFLLASIDGRPLPTTRPNDPISNGATIVREQLVLDGEGAAWRSTTVQGPSPYTQTISLEKYAYTRAGDVVTIGDVICMPGAPCLPHSPESGPIGANGLTLMPVPTLGSTVGSVLVYQRVTIMN